MDVEVQRVTWDELQRLGCTDLSPRMSVQNGDSIRKVALPYGQDSDQCFGGSGDWNSINGDYDE
jgi:hypothetical protein